MAERRMVAKSIIDTDAFLDMPVTARLLYYDLIMRADDDGFISSPRRIAKVIGVKDGDISALINNGYLIPFESGVMAIAHWKICNSIQKDRYKPTFYQNEYNRLTVNTSRVYELLDTECIQNGSKSDTQVRLGEDRTVKDREGEVSICAGKPPRFIPPTPEEVTDYCQERGNLVDVQRFIDYYTANGWRVGKNPMKDWKAAVRNWEHSSQPAKGDGLDNLRELYELALAKDEKEHDKC